MAFSGMEWIIVGLVVVILFFGGAKKIPEFAQNLGRARGEYERGRLEVEKQIASERAAVVAGSTGGSAGGATAGASAAPATDSTDSTKTFCSKCGAQAAAGAAFCSKCGNALATPA